MNDNKINSANEASNAKKPKSQTFVDAQRAYNLEKQITKNKLGATLLLKFPDINLSREKIKSFTSTIDRVSFQMPVTQRYCYIQLKKNANVQHAIRELSQITCGLGKLTAVESTVSVPTPNVEPENIDPYTLFVGNIPKLLKVQKIKTEFPTAKSISIIFSKINTNFKNALVKFKNIEDSLDAYHTKHNLILDNVELSVQFRRLKIVDRRHVSTEWHELDDGVIVENAEDCTMDVIDVSTDQECVATLQDSLQCNRPAQSPDSTVCTATEATSSKDLYNSYRNEDNYGLNIDVYIRNTKNFFNTK